MDERQAEHFIFGLNTRIRAMVRMWKPPTVAETVECARFAEEHLGIRRDFRPAEPIPQAFTGRTSRNFFRGNNSRPPPYGNRFTPRGAEAGPPKTINAIASDSSNISTWRSRGTGNRGRNGRGRNTKGQSSWLGNSQSNAKGPTRVDCWGCGGPHLRWDCLENSWQT